MPVFVNTFFEKRAAQLLDLAARVEQAFSSAGLEYLVAGGLAVYLHVEEKEPDAGRLTVDIDIVVRPDDLGKIARAVEPFGFSYESGMLVQTREPSNRRAVHLVFDDRVDWAEAWRINGIRVVSLQDLVRMRLTIFRAKDEMHLKDLDEVSLITPEVEDGLPGDLLERLTLVRARS